MQHTNRFTHPALGPAPLAEVYPAGPPPPPLGNIAALHDAATLRHLKAEVDRLRDWLDAEHRPNLIITVSRSEFTVSSDESLWSLDRPRGFPKQPAWCLFAADQLLRQFYTATELRVTVGFLGLVVSGVMNNVGVRTATWPTMKTLTLVCETAESLFRWPTTYTAWFQLHGAVKLAIELPAFGQSSDFVQRLMRWTRDFVAGRRLVSSRGDNGVDVLQFRNVQQQLAKDLTSLARDPARGRCKSREMWPEEEDALDAGRVHVTYKNWGRIWCGVDEYLPSGVFEDD